MAIEILGRDESVAKIISCKHCGAKLKYFPIDVIRDYTSDYTGDRDYYNCIICPACKNQVIVK